MYMYLCLIFLMLRSHCLLAECSASEPAVRKSTVSSAYTYTHMSVCIYIHTCTFVCCLHINTSFLLVQFSGVYEQCTHTCCLCHPQLSMPLNASAKGARRCAPAYSRNANQYRSTVNDPGISNQIHTQDNIIIAMRIQKYTSFPLNRPVQQR